MRLVLASTLCTTAVFLSAAKLSHAFADMPNVLYSHPRTVPSSSSNVREHHKRQRRILPVLDMVSTLNEERPKDRGYRKIQDGDMPAEYTLRQSSIWNAQAAMPSQTIWNAQAAMPSQMTDFWAPVVSAALLVTGNTFGAGSLVLPELVQGPGLAASSGVFAVAYFMNLLSGWVIAEVAIQQKEGNGNEVPSSFKEMVEENLKSPSLAALVSAVSFIVNALVFSFDMSRVGLMANQLSGGIIQPALVSVLWATMLVTLLTTQSSQRISSLAGICCTVLFASFGSLLLPGLAHSDPVAAWTQAGVAADSWSALGELSPVILMALVYQNIVPTITRLHNYDRNKTMTSLVLGSFIPLVMYLGWCFACLGGGIDSNAVGMSGPLLAVFSISTLAGSSIGCGLSCASELETFLKPTREYQTLPSEPQGNGFQLPSAVATVALPLSVTLTVTTFGDGDLTPALSLAGGLGSPLLYGVLPVCMAWNQRQELSKDAAKSTSSNQPTRIPTSAMGVLAVGAATMFGNEVLEQISHLAQSAAAVL